MKSLKKVYQINSSIHEVWNALVDPSYITKWGGGPAVMDENEGTEFSLWGGDIWGKNIKVVKEKELIQEWYSGEWETPSRVTFKLSQKDNMVELELDHNNIPDNEFSDIDDGWDTYYLGPIKELLEK